MTDLQLESDEGIILQTSEVDRYGYKELNLDEMVLTNKNIICVYEKSNGIFAKPDIMIDKIPISTIKVVNGQAQVMIHDSDDYGKGVQLLFVSGHREHFVFNNSPKNEMPIWVNAINKVIVGEPESKIPVATEDTYISHKAKPKGKDSIFGGLAGAFNVDIQGVMEKAQSKIFEFTESMDGKIQSIQNEPASEENIMCTAKPSETQTPVETPPIIQPTEIIMEAPPIPQSNEQSEIKNMFCSNCGTKLNDGAKFCHGCGAAVGTVTPQAQTPPHIKPEANHSERQQEYVGKILKCPHCGGVISETTAVCPDCGMQITGKSALYSVRTFKEQLMNIEMQKKNHVLGIFSLSVDVADEQKLTLIRNFPIPNTVDDILEFMLLAIANIDVKLSKKSAMNRYYSSAKTVESTYTISRTISDAWVSKMEQVYRKAEIAFPNEPVFADIQKMYFDKMKELKMKVN